MMDSRSMKEEVTRLHAQICSGLADPNRILIIYCVSDSPKNVTEIATRLELPQPTVSRHLKVLRERGILRAERDGQNIIYSLGDQRIVQALDLLRATMADALKDQAALVQGAVIIQS
jgi:ArsR family transcriptional regulator